MIYQPLFHLTSALVFVLLCTPEGAYSAATAQESAVEESQKYKEGKYIVEKAKIMKVGR